MQRPTLRIAFLAGLTFSLLSPTPLAANFFRREVEAARQVWQLVPVDEVLEDAFPGEPVPVNREYRLEINIPGRRLFLRKGNGILKSYPVAVGSFEHRTPARRGAVRDISWNPWWFPPDVDWARNDRPTPPGPGNPLGRVKMPLSGDIVLHGTNNEASIGSPVSHGCLRMRNRDIEELAWFFQRQFSGESDPTLVEGYRQMRRTTFHVKLEETILVDLVYDRVAIEEKSVVIYPDIYRKVRNVGDEILEELSRLGIPPWEVDLLRFDDLVRELEGGRGPQVIPIEELLLSFAPSESPPGS